MHNVFLFFWHVLHDQYIEGEFVWYFLFGMVEKLHDISQEKNIFHIFDVVEEGSTTETFVAEEWEAASLKQI